MPNIFKRIKTLWILSGCDIKKNKEGAFTIDGVVRPQLTEEPRPAKIIKMKSEETIINEVLNK